MMAAARTGMDAGGPMNRVEDVRRQRTYMVSQSMYLGAPLADRRRVNPAQRFSGFRPETRPEPDHPFMP